MPDFQGLTKLIVKHALALEELLAERLLQATAFDSIIATLQNEVRFNAARRDSCRA
jgi:hypothetical protein